MNYKYCCIVDKDNYYKTFVLVMLQPNGDIERIDSYALQDGECLIDAPAPSDMFAPRWDGATWIETGTVEITPEMVDTARAAKLREISAACEQIIYKGIELDGKRYALTTADQINVQNLLLQVQAGAATVLYHADGELCAPYSALDIMALAAAAVRHVTYNTTYCNHLLAWARTASYDELEHIVYGAQLPQELQAHMDMVMEGETA